MRIPRPVAIVLLALVASPSFAAEARLTKKCNTSSASRLMLSGVLPGARNQMLEAVSHPDLYPVLYASLWQPRKITPLLDSGGSYADAVILDMDPLQDVVEMSATMLADPEIAKLGVKFIGGTGGYGCFPINPPGLPQTVTEYYNSTLNHYFLSSSSTENAYIDSGQAGPGWVRTGESFRTEAPNECSSLTYVFRFYGKGPNSHFFTSGAEECGGLRKPDSGWQIEGIAFGAMAPKNGICEYSSMTPAYRLYNNRWMYNDSNHRYTIRQDIYQQMMAKGWIGEGVALCVPNGP